MKDLIALLLPVELRQVFLLGAPLQLGGRNSQVRPLYFIRKEKVDWLQSGHEGESNDAGQRG